MKKQEVEVKAGEPANAGCPMKYWANDENRKISNPDIGNIVPSQSKIGRCNDYRKAP